MRAPLASIRRYGPRPAALAARAAIAFALLALPAAGSSASAAPGGGGLQVFLPFVGKNAVKDVEVANGSFEWNTVEGLPDPIHCRYDDWRPDDQRTSNQPPQGWDFYSPASGQLMPFPTKLQEGSLVPATSGGEGEYVHKCEWHLPENERPGMPQSLIMHGNWTYKAFSDHIPQALRLSQVITGVPGLQVRLTGWILGETHDVPSPPNTKLEDDHFIASVPLGNVVDTRYYAEMIQTFDVPGNTRPWNFFVLTATVPANGLLNLTVITQQNWPGNGQGGPGGTDFFLDDFRATYVLD